MPNPLPAMCVPPVFFPTCSSVCMSSGSAITALLPLFSIRLLPISSDSFTIVCILPAVRFYRSCWFFCLLLVLRSYTHHWFFLVLPSISAVATIASSIPNLQPHHDKPIVPLCITCDTRLRLPFVCLFMYACTHTRTRFTRSFPHHALLCAHFALRAFTLWRALRLLYCCPLLHVAVCGYLPSHALHCLARAAFPHAHHILPATHTFAFAHLHMRTLLRFAFAFILPCRTRVATPHTLPLHLRRRTLVVWLA